MFFSLKNTSVQKRRQKIEKNMLLEQQLSEVALLKFIFPGNRSFGLHKSTGNEDGSFVQKKINIEKKSISTITTIASVSTVTAIATESWSDWESWGNWQSCNSWSNWHHWNSATT
ncbi:hypothetical protein BpHYR1_045457 [Brachionus plicatilis]|uniref:Uncharacterized protein n=1 Tax=Brachionus plicatilis TaxID=10195 RepID=A0A3M7T4P7_BRAPC|nr:hypothetical protein BpHYR1_045457 [Brachionus plicatilis]